MLRLSRRAILITTAIPITCSTMCPTVPTLTRQRPQSGILNDKTFLAGSFGPAVPAGWQVAGVADFNGDGKLDYALFNPDSRQTAIWYSSGVSLLSGAYGPTLPGGWSLVAVGDFNADGKPDYVLENFLSRRTAIWYLNNNVFTSGTLGPDPARWLGGGGSGGF